MPATLREWGHLIRLVVVVAVCVGAFVLIRAAVIPVAFGQYGHYRPGALDDVRLHAAAYAGQAECVACHETEDQARKQGKHARISCEACHGAQAVHAADPSASKPAKPDVAPLCSNCHEKDAAKPAWFPQVVTKEHYGAGEACNTCHQPHQPKL